MDRPRGLERQQWIWVGQEAADRRCLVNAGRQEHQLPDLPVGVGAMSLDHPIGQSGGQSVGQPVAQHGVGRSKPTDTPDEGGGITVGQSSPTQAQSRGQSHAGIRVGQLILQPRSRTRLPHQFGGRSQRPDGLDAHLTLRAFGHA